MIPPEACPVTGQPLKPGQTVADQAALQVWYSYRRLPTIVADAYNTLTGIRSTPATGGSHAGTTKDPIPLAALNRLDTAVDTIWDRTQALLAWMRPGAHLTPPTVVDRHTWAHQVRTIIQQATTGTMAYTRWPEAPQAHHPLQAAAHTLEHAAYPDRAPRHYAGPCPNCGNDLTTPRTQGTLTCRHCGQQVNIQDQRHHMALILQASVYPRNTARLAASWIAGRNIPPETVRTWTHRHQLTPVQGAGKLFRVADIVKLAGTLPVKR